MKKGAITLAAHRRDVAALLSPWRNRACRFWWMSV